MNVYCKKEGLHLLPGLPFRRDVAESISRGELIIDTIPEMKIAFQGLLDEVLALAKEATQ